MTNRMNLMKAQNLSVIHNISSILRNTNIYGRVHEENKTFPLLDQATSLLHKTHFFFKVLPSDQAQTFRLSHSKDIKPNDF
jgi:hypothetical protein